MLSAKMAAILFGGGGWVYKKNMVLTYQEKQSLSSMMKGFT